MPESHSRLAYRRIESLIVTLQLAPGSLVTERRLIELADLGRTPVREAIQRLEWEGLLQIRPRAGLMIAPLDEHAPGMIIATRRQLEPLAARLMVGAIDASARKRLIDCAKAMTVCSVTGDSTSFLIADKTFDEILEDSCPNPYLSRALAPLQTHSRRYWFASASQASLERAADLHVKVIRAVLSGDVDAAGTEMDALLDGIESESSAITGR